MWEWAISCGFPGIQQNLIWISLDNYLDTVKSVLFPFQKFKNVQCVYIHEVVIKKRLQSAMEVNSAKR